MALAVFFEEVEAGGHGSDSVGGCSGGEAGSSGGVAVFQAGGQVEAVVVSMEKSCGKGMAGADGVDDAGFWKIHTTLHMF